MPTCYFTYSWEEDSKDAEALAHLLSYLKRQIEKLSNNAVTVIYDRESFKEGDNFLERERQIKESDCVLLFFSPEYKRKVALKENTGVYREYKLLLERTRSDYSGVVSILLSGTLNTAVTDEFENIIFWDLSRLKGQIIKNHGKLTYGDDLKRAINRISQKAIKEACAVAYCKEHTYDSIEDEYKALFLDSSALSPLPVKCIIKTSAQEQIIAQTACIVIGRKGSGKTTLLQAIQTFDPSYYQKNYKIQESLTAESFDINFIYGTLIATVRKEFDVINMSYILDTFWEIIFVLQSMVTVGEEIESFQIDRDDERYNNFCSIVNKLKNLLGVNQRTLCRDFPHNAICHCAVELLSNYIKDCVLNHASGETPLTGALSSMDAFTILTKVFGPKRFKNFCTGVKQCTKKIFLALDGFDSHSEDFRATTNRLVETNREEYQFRTDFENILFRELLLTVSNLKYSPTTGLRHDFFSIVDFCIILPQDRWDGVSRIDRDIVKRAYCNLDWDAHDLLEMLVKRLEYFYKITTGKTNRTLYERFNNILENKMHNIPKEINITVDGFHQKISLFNYLLRLTFWRPRDMIKNFAIIMKLSKGDEGLTEDIIESIIKKYLVKGSKSIIIDEFFNEYKNVYMNLSEILLKFKSSDFIQDFNVFYELLSKIDIYATTSEDFSKTDNKLRLLYKLGVIGLYFSKSNAEKNGYGYHICYSFNEGLDPIDEFIDQGQRDEKVKIVFNPIFVKYLALNFNTKEIVCDYTWEYIKANHELKDHIRRP